MEVEMAKPSPAKDSLKEPDKFLSFSHRLLQQMVAHKNAILIAAGILMAVLAVVAGVRYRFAQAEKHAFARLQELRAAYEPVLEEEGAKAAFAKVAPDFERLLGEYGGTSAGRFARTLYAGYALDAGDLGVAITAYQQSLADFPAGSFYRRQVLLGLGHAYAAHGEPQPAIEAFEAAAAGGGSSLAAEALFNLGRLYEAQGDGKRSREAFGKLAAQFPESTYAPVAKEKV